MIFYWKSFKTWKKNWRSLISLLTIFKPLLNTWTLSTLETIFIKIMATQLEMLNHNKRHLYPLYWCSVGLCCEKCHSGGPDIVQVMTKMIMMWSPMTTTTNQEAKVRRLTGSCSSATVTLRPKHLSIVITLLLWSQYNQNIKTRNCHCFWFDGGDHDAGGRLPSSPLTAGCDAPSDEKTFVITIQSPLAVGITSAQA